MRPELLALLLAVVAAYGAHLLYTAVAYGWRGIAPRPTGPVRRSLSARVRERLAQAGLGDVRPVEFLAVVLLLALLGAAIGAALFGGWPAAASLAVAAGTIPVAGARSRRRTRRELAREAWPRLLEELRLQVVTLGRSIPQALFAIGDRAPAELRPAFEAARREWLRSTDLERCLEVLRGQLADPTADAVCETLLIAHEVGGSDVDRRLRDLVEDRIQDLQGRKDARAKQAGVRFARLFVLLVPAGMAVIGLAIGDGRAAYAAPSGQVAVLVALALLAGCWWWATLLLRLPDEARVFAPHEPPARHTWPVDR